LMDMSWKTFDGGAGDSGPSKGVASTSTTEICHCRKVPVRRACAKCGD